MGNGASNEGRPQTAGGGARKRSPFPPSATPPDAAQDATARRNSTNNRPLLVPQDVLPAVQPYSKRPVPPLTEASVNEIIARDGDDEFPLVPQTATARLQKKHMINTLAQGELQPTPKRCSLDAPKTGAAPLNSPLLSPRPPSGAPPNRTSPFRGVPTTTAAGAPETPSPDQSGHFARATAQTSAPDPSSPRQNLHGLLIAPDLQADVWCPPEFGPLMRSPRLTAEDADETYQDKKTVFYQVYLQTHGGSVTNNRLKQRASAAVLIREREKVPRAPRRPGDPSPSPTLDTADPSTADGALSADPVDADQYVRALYKFSREKTKTTFFIDQDGEMRRLYHTSGWHRLPTLNALANSGDNASQTSAEEPTDQPRSSPGQTHKSHRSTKPSASSSSSSRKKSGTARKPREGSSTKRPKTRPRSSSIRSNGDPRSFMSASIWSSGSHESADSEFFTSNDPPPAPQPILMRTSSFRRTSSTSSLKYLADGDKNAPPQGASEVPASKGRPVRPRVSFSANTAEFRASRAQPPSSQREFFDVEEEEEPEKPGAFNWGHITSDNAPTQGERDTLALLKGKMRS